METMTLEQLKAENAAAEEAAKAQANAGGAAGTTEDPGNTGAQTNGDASIDVLSDDFTFDSADSEDVGDKDKTENDSSDEGAKQEESEELESWMKGDESDSDSSGVPLKKHIDVRTKLKQKVRDKDDEIGRLQQEIDQLKNATGGSGKTSAGLPARPRMSDFEDTDNPEEAFSDALAEWMEKRQDAKFEEHRTKINERSQQQMAETRLNTALEEHYQRANQLVSSGKVSEEAYQTADQNVRQMFENLHPGQGDDYADTIAAHLNSLGEGSEKVWFQLGRNASALNTLRDKMVSDPTGIQATLYLGKLHSQVSAASPQKQKSQAPAPASQIQGDSSSKGTSKARAAKSQYEEAHKAKDTQRAFDIKRKAKAAGIDTSSWNR